MCLAWARLRNQCWFRYSSQNLPLEAFDEGVSGWVSRVNELQLYSVLVRPLVKHAAGELRSVVYEDRFGQAPPHGHSVEYSDDPRAWKRGVDFNRGQLPGEAVHDGQTGD